MVSFSFVLISTIFAVASSSNNANKEKENTIYGVDHSWPMHYQNEQNKRYEDFMKGCYEQNTKGPLATNEKLHNTKVVAACNQSERDRLEMNLNQPKLMENYTNAGYAKVHTPSNVFQILQTFFQLNERYFWPEFWNEGNTFINHFSVSTMLLDIGRQDVAHPLAANDYETIIKSVQNVLESWTNQRLVLTSTYGIRSYEEGSILAPHVDRLPLVSSAIINIFQRNVTEEWILEVIGHDGIAHNLTSELGEMIMYESHSVIHGRPYPLKGKGALYGSIFFHFEPLYHTMRHAGKVGDQYWDGIAKKGVDQASKLAFESILQDELKKKPLRSMQQLNDKDDNTISTDTSNNDNVDIDKQNVVGEEQDKKNKKKHLYRINTPRYVWSEYQNLYDQQFFFEYEDNITPKASKIVFGKISAHTAASNGDLSALKEMAKTQGKNELFKADHNGWRPIHEAARGGRADVLEYLLEEGADVNERTNKIKGGNPLFWANKNRVKNAKAIAILKKYGAVSMAPIDKKLLEKFADNNDDEDSKKDSDNEIKK